MKYLRKLISSMLAALLLLTIALPSDVFADATVLLYSQSFNAADQHTALKIEPESSVALKFKAQAGFKSVTVACPSWSDSEGTLKFSLYKWDTDYSETVGKNALAEKSFVNYRDNSNLTLSFSEKAAGTYLLVIENPETEDKSVGVWTLPSALSNTVFYNNGIITNAALEGSVIISGSGAGSFFGTIAEEIQSYPVKRDVVNVQPESWDGVDSLGRVLSAEGDVRSANSKKFVGLFYWTWHNNFAPSTPPRVAGEIVKKYPEAQNDFYHSAWQGTASGTSYFWGEPLYGFYTTIDKFVLRKHAELLADAGVDVIIFDCTNGTWIWEDSCMALLDTFAKARADGVNTPQVAFMLNFAGNSNSKTQLIELYDKIYSKNLYRDLWFMWEGKPLIMAYPEAMDQASPAASSDEVNTIKSFFTFRRNEPTYFASDKTYSKKTWGWCSVYPQTKFGVRSDGSVEQMTVSVAQNATDTQLIAMNAPVAGVHGRSYTKGSYSYTYKKYGQSNVTVSKSIADSMLYGLNFQQQWDYALKVDPDFIFVTGWNEWVAGRHAEWLGTENAFPDQFSEEYSRDIEPAKGPLGDNYYYQLVENIRRFKGVTSGKFAVAEKTIDINAGASAWSNVTSSYDDYVDYKDGRNRTGYQGTRYKADKVRNDIIHSKFAYDSENLYFMVQTVNNITAYTDTNWMRLLISVDGGSSNGWEGFNFIVNRNNPTAAAAKVEKFNGGWKFSTAGSAKYSVKGNTMTIAIPKSVLGISASGKLPVINFKWVDNAISAADGDILDVYTYGDAAPDARFTYRVDIQDGVQKLGASSGTASSVPTPTAPAAAKPTASLAAVPTAQATADVTLPNTEAPSPGTLTPGGETETPIQSETPTADDTGSPAATAENTGVSDVTGGGSEHATDKNSQETENSAETAGVPSGGNGKKSSSGCYGIAGGIIAVIIAAGAVILIVLRKKKGV